MKSQLIGYNKLPEDLQLLASYQMQRLVSHRLPKDKGLYEIRSIMQLLNIRVQAEEPISIPLEEVSRVVRHLTN